MKKIILCLDGTWNSTYAKDKREDGRSVIKPSNVLKMARALKSHNGDVQQIVYYDTGVGSMSKYTGFSNWLLGKADKLIGGIWGAGFETNIEDAFTFLINNFEEGDEVYVFGFSRGAATARALTQFLAWMGGLPSKSDAYFMPLLFREYIKYKGTENILDILPNIKNRQSTNEDNNASQSEYFKGWQEIEIEFLGVWDTVLSLGGRIIPVENRKYFIKKCPAKCVKHARQALAIDEKRADFQPEIWIQPNQQAKTEQTLKQQWFAGVHSNIGGGYANDGLANITFHWMTDELLELYPDIKFHDEPFAHFRKHIQNDLVNSKTWFYKFKDTITFRKGRRDIYTILDEKFSRSNLTINFTALQRLKSDPNIQKEDGDLKHPLLDIYRPKNLIKYVNDKGIDQTLNPFKTEADRNRSIEIEKVENFLKLTSSIKIINTRSKTTSTGISLKLNKKYKIKLTEIKPIYDMFTKSDFAGWLPTKDKIKITDNKITKRAIAFWLSSKNKLTRKFHDFIQTRSRMPEAKIFSLIGEINDKQIDLGKIWKQIGQVEFEIDLKNYFEDDSKEVELFVYFNDVKGFYWNNRGSFTIEVSKQE